MSDGRVSVLLETESTYLFVGGGVSTWCNILVVELPQVDYHIYAIAPTCAVGRGQSYS